MDSDKPQITPEKLAEAAQAFVKSEFGIEFMKVLKARQSGYRKTADNFDTPHEQKVSANERAAGIGEVIEFLDNQVLYAEHPEYFNVVQR